MGFTEKKPGLFGLWKVHGISEKVALEGYL